MAIVGTFPGNFLGAPFQGSTVLSGPFQASNITHEAVNIHGLLFAGGQPSLPLEFMGSRFGTPGARILPSVYTGGVQLGGGGFAVGPFSGPTGPTDGGIFSSGLAGFNSFGEPMAMGFGMPGMGYGSFGIPSTMGAGGGFGMNPMMGGMNPMMMGMMGGMGMNPMMGGPMPQQQGGGGSNFRPFG